MKKIMLIFGTRPEAIKMCPLVIELKRRKNLCVKVSVTGQHKKLLSDVLDTFNVKPDYDLSIMKEGQSLSDITSGVLSGIEKVLKTEHPDIVLVHGDTSTAFAASLAAFYEKIPVAHVEAGLRTHDIYSPYPEEFNREAISLIAKYHFAPTIEAKQNLLDEGKSERNVFVTGNTVIDALKYTVKKNFSHPNLIESPSKLILLTTHRRENIGDGMRSVFRAVKRICAEFSDLHVIFPCHPNPEIRQLVNKELSGADRIDIIEPQDPISFHNLLSRSYLVLTDSGGIQEECSALRIPTLVLREHTERTEGITAGILRLVGTDEESIYENTKLLLQNNEEYAKMKNSKNPFGDGNASEIIADILEKA